MFLIKRTATVYVGVYGVTVLSDLNKTAINAKRSGFSIFVIGFQET